VKIQEKLSEIRTH